jgi:DUF1680 family protein
MLRLSRRGALLMTMGSAGLGLAGAGHGWAQAPSPVRIEAFPLDRVRLKPSLFLTAVETNQKYLLSVDPDRLLHNFRAGAGLEPKAPVYGGWESRGIAGHSLGHYQSAVSLMYAQTGKPEFRQRALYITQELAACQAKNGDGYAGGTTVDRNDKNGDGKTVDGKIVYEELRQGRIDTSAGLNGGWVPIYTYHKVMAGALDAQRYCDDPASLQVAIGLAGYLGSVFEALNDDQVQKILSVEHGGISETYAELYARTGDPRWRTLALRVRHHAILDPLKDGRDDLAGKHANTQIPKLIGLARTYEVDPDPEHAKTAMFFWETVTKDHSYVIGGNSEYEHFGPPRKLADKLSQQTCECCNSYNMLKLTRHLYSWSGDKRYFDFYERAHLNHILSQQDPDTGMFTYFSPLASGFARVHSTPDNDFWCCHGTGMENHSKHGDSIWWRAGDKVLVNLFYPSTLDWREKGVVLDMDTDYPYKDTITLRATKAPKPVEVALRVPGWCPDPSATINGKRVTAAPKDGYLPLMLKAGDVVALHLPMPVYSETMPDDDRLVAYLSGPLVLAADLGPASQPWDSFDPVVVNTRNDGVLAKADGAQTFTLAEHSRPRALTLRPYMAQHHNRTAVYFRRFTAAEWPAIEASYAADAKAKADIRARTVDVMRLGEQQPEADHNFKGTPNTVDSGNLTERNRMVNDGYFQFDLMTAPGPLLLQVRYDGSARDKDFDILIDGQVLAHETLGGPRTATYNVLQYRIPQALTQGKRKITVRFEGHHNQWAAVYEARLIKEMTHVA